MCWLTYQCTTHDLCVHYSYEENDLFLRKQWYVYMHQCNHFYDILAPSCTTMQQFSGKLLVYFLYVQKSQPSCWQILWSHLAVMLSGQCILRTCWPDTCWHVTDMQTCLGGMSFGGAWWHNMVPTFKLSIAARWHVFSIIIDLAFVCHHGQWQTCRVQRSNTSSSQGVGWYNRPRGYNNWPKQYPKKEKFWGIHPDLIRYVFTTGSHMVHKSISS